MLTPIVTPLSPFPLLRTGLSSDSYPPPVLQLITHGRLTVHDVRCVNDAQLPLAVLPDQDAGVGHHVLSGDALSVSCQGVFSGASSGQVVRDSAGQSHSCAAYVRCCVSELAISFLTVIFIGNMRLL